MPSVRVQWRAAPRGARHEAARRALCTLSAPYHGLPDLDYPSTTAISWSPPAAASACTARRSTSPPCWPASARHQGSRRRHLARLLHALRSWDTSTWSRGPCSPSTTRSARGCYPCLTCDLRARARRSTENCSRVRPARPPAGTEDVIENSRARHGSEPRHGALYHWSYGAPSSPGGIRTRDDPVDSGFISGPRGRPSCSERKQTTHASIGERHQGNGTPSLAAFDPSVRRRRVGLSSRGPVASGYFGPRDGRTLIRRRRRDPSCSAPSNGANRGRGVWVSVGRKRQPTPPGPRRWNEPAGREPRGRTGR